MGIMGTIGPSMKSEADWQAESDLNTLIEAERIKKDAKRLRAAMKKKRELKKALDNTGK